MTGNTVHVLLAAALVTIVYCQPSIPFSGYRASDCRPGLFFADKHNLCWYHQCVQHLTPGSFKLVPRNCSLGSRLPYSYFADRVNPCSVRLHGDGDWECSREKKLDTEDPACASELVCENGGRLRHRHGSCWCDCPRGWQGGNLCEKPTGDVHHDQVPNECDEDISKNCKPGQCQHEGICHPQCGGYWCECPTPFRWGRHCEEFSCDDDNECYNGGTCDRGTDGNREYRICHCPRGFMGRQCKIDRRK